MFRVVRRFGLLNVYFLLLAARESRVSEPWSRCRALMQHEGETSVAGKRRMEMAEPTHADLGIEVTARNGHCRGNGEEGRRARRDSEESKGSRYGYHTAADSKSEGCV